MERDEGTKTDRWKDKEKKGIRKKKMIKIKTDGQIDGKKVSKKDKIIRNKGIEKEKMIKRERKKDERRKK